MKRCKVCGDETEAVFNIGFKATPICESCANAIFLQQATWYVQNARTFTKGNDSKGNDSQQQEKQ